MMAVLDLAAGRGIELSVIFSFLLLTLSSSAVVASDNPVFNVKSRGCSPGFNVLDRAERKLAAVPAPEPAVSGNGPVSSPSSPLPPSTPPNRRPAVISPSGNTPGQDLPPKLLSPPPVVAAPTTAPAPVSKQSNLAVILGVTLGVVAVLLVSISAAAYIKPEWLPCCQGRSSRLVRYERHEPT